METEAYACYNKCPLKRESSSSGGLYVKLAETVMKSGGKIFAVVYDENFETKHVEITSEEQLRASQGSKYIPSRLGDIFIEVRAYLRAGVQVLFVGTPCQCSGLISYLGKPYENLITIDFVCHGVPSRLAWWKYLSDLEEDNIDFDRKLVSINMRDKNSGWSKYNYSWHFVYSDGYEKFVRQGEISYMKGFTSDIYLRPSCYECRFKGIKRQTDITLGDYWGVWDIQPDLDDDKGISLLLIHTENGKKLLDSISDEIEIKKALLEKAVERNPSMVSSAKVKKKRDEFFERIERGEKFDSAVNACTAVEKTSTIDRMKGKMKRMMNNLKLNGGG